LNHDTRNFLHAASKNSLSAPQCSNEQYLHLNNMFLCISESYIPKLLTHMPLLHSSANCEHSSTSCSQSRPETVQINALTYVKSTKKT